MSWWGAVIESGTCQRSIKKETREYLFRSYDDRKRKFKWEVNEYDNKCERLHCLMVS